MRQSKAFGETGRVFTYISSKQGLQEQMNVAKHAQKHILQFTKQYLTDYYTDINHSERLIYTLLPKVFTHPSK